MIRNLTTDCLIKKVLAAAVTGTTTLTTSTVDMEGYRGVTFVTTLGSANAGNTLSVQESNDDGNTDAYAAPSGGPVAGASVLPIVEVYAPAKRYVQGVVTRGVTTTVGEVYAILTGRERPVSNPSAVLAANV